MKRKQLPPQYDFVILQNSSLNPVHNLIKHEVVLPHQKHDSHPILAEYSPDQFSISINENDTILSNLLTPSHLNP